MDVKVFIENETSLSLDEVLTKMNISIEELSRLSAQNFLSLLRIKLGWKGCIYSSFLDAYEKPFSHPLHFLAKEENLPQLQRNGRENVYSRTKVPKPKIAFLGRSNAGKSTMINSFLGVKLLPATWNPTTSAILYVKHKEDRPAFIEDNVCFFKKGDGVNEWDEQKLSDEAHYNKWLLESGSIELITDLGTHLGYNDSAQIGAAVVFVDCPLLKGCDLLDTPGPTMGMEKDAENSARAIEVADAVVYLYPANASFMEEDVNVIQRILKRNGNLEDQFTNLFVVATQVDTLANEFFTKADYSKESRRIADNACGIISGAILDTLEQIIEKHSRKGETVEYRGEKKTWGGIFEENGKKMISLKGERYGTECLLQKSIEFLKFMPGSAVSREIQKKHWLEYQLRERFFAYSTTIRFDERTRFEDAFESFLCDEAERRRDNKKIDIFCESFLFAKENAEGAIGEKILGKKPAVIKCKNGEDEKQIFKRMARHAFKAGERVAVLCLLQKNHQTIEQWLDEALHADEEDNVSFDEVEWRDCFEIRNFEAPVEELLCDKMIIPMFWRDGMPEEDEIDFLGQDGNYYEGPQYEYSDSYDDDPFGEEEEDHEYPDDSLWYEQRHQYDGWDDDYSDEESACNEDNFGDGYSRQNAWYESEDEYATGTDCEDRRRVFEEDRFAYVDPLNKRLYEYMISAKESLYITYWGIPHPFIKEFKWGKYSYVDSNKNKLDESGRTIRILLPW
jgi:hypothetical protein